MIHLIEERERESTIIWQISADIIIHYKHVHVQNKHVQYKIIYIQLRLCNLTPNEK